MQQTGDYTIRPFKLDDLVNVARLYLSFYDERNNVAMGKGQLGRDPLSEHSCKALCGDMQMRRKETPLHP